MRKWIVCYFWFVGLVWDVKFLGIVRVVICGDDSIIRLWDSWLVYCVVVFLGYLDVVFLVFLR